MIGEKESGNNKQEDKLAAHLLYNFAEVRFQDSVDIFRGTSDISQLTGTKRKRVKISKYGQKECHVFPGFHSNLMCLMIVSSSVPWRSQHWFPAATAWSGWRYRCGPRLRWCRPGPTRCWTERRAPPTGWLEVSPSPPGEPPRRSWCSLRPLWSPAWLQEREERGQLNKKCAFKKYIYTRIIPNGVFGEPHTIYINIHSQSTQPPQNYPNYNNNHNTTNDTIGDVLQGTAVQISSGYLWWRSQLLL